jgi:glycerophosphoryl diester phosphodiesterase
LLFEEIPPDWESRLARLDCVAIDANFRALGAPLVAAAHRAGYKVLTYTPNEPEVIASLSAWGVDLVITDAIDRVAP